MAHVSLITLGIGDLARATAFYEALGWRRSSASVDGVVAFLRGGAVVLSLFGREDLAEDAHIQDEVRDGFGRSALAMNVESREAVDEVLASAEAAGARITKPGTATDWGGYSGYFADPDGHLWEVANNPGFPLRPDGQVVLPDEQP